MSFLIDTSPGTTPLPSCLVVDTWADRPSSPDDGDFLRIGSTGQIYRAESGSYVEGFHPEVSSTGNAADGNVDGEFLSVMDDTVYTWDQGSSIWQAAVGSQGYVEVQNWADRPSSPSDGDVLKVLSTGQIYRAESGSYTLSPSE